jgi:predicted metal-binding membrane protein
VGGHAALALARLNGVPLPVIGAIAAAWAAAIAAELSGAAGAIHHDALIEGGASFGASLIGFLLAWQVMIAAMMLPSSLPMIRIFSIASGRAPGRGRAMIAFLGAYAMLWSAFGLLAFLGDAGLHALVQAWPWLHSNDWVIVPAVLALAGAFQFTALKDACLDKCRHPASFLHRHYRRGTSRAFALGARHAAFCLGCCWALMLVMFAVGVASLVWMALLTLLMVHEKTRPSGARAVPVTGVTLLALASVTFLYGTTAAGP